MSIFDVGCVLIVLTFKISYYYRLQALLTSLRFYNVHKTSVFGLANGARTCWMVVHLFIECTRPKTTSSWPWVQLNPNSIINFFKVSIFLYQEIQVLHKRVWITVQESMDHGALLGSLGAQNYAIYIYSTLVVKGLRNKNFS